LTQGLITESLPLAANATMRERSDVWTSERGMRESKKKKDRGILGETELFLAAARCIWTAPARLRSKLSMDNYKRSEGNIMSNWGKIVVSERRNKRGKKGGRWGGEEEERFGVYWVNKVRCDKTIFKRQIAAMSLKPSWD